MDTFISDIYYLQNNNEGMTASYKSQTLTSCPRNCFFSRRAWPICRTISPRWGAGIWQPQMFQHATFEQQCSKLGYLD